MKPCFRNRRLIAWLALNALDTRRTRQLQAHFETCEGCRRYLAEISNVTDKLVAVETNSDVQASESFHRKVAAKLRTAKPDSLGDILAAYFARLNWRVALPAIAVLVLVSVIFSFWPQPPKIVSLPQAHRQAVLVSDADNDLAPTIANYQRVANQSLAKLDALLTKQGNRPLPPMPIYTASTLGLANESF
jgi:anti-sigma factor RsiW